MKKILAGIILVLALALPANAAGSSNVTLLYGWNGTNFVPLLTDGNGTLMTTMNTTDSVGLNPNLNNTYDLGTTALLWANLYARSIRGGSGALSLFAGENERLTLTAGGNVGIGTTIPRSLLQADGNASINGTLLVEGINVTGRQISDNTTLGNAVASNNNTAFAGLGTKVNLT